MTYYVNKYNCLLTFVNKTKVLLVMGMRWILTSGTSRMAQFRATLRFLAVCQGRAISLALRAIVWAEKKQWPFTALRIGEGRGPLRVAEWLGNIQTVREALLHKKSRLVM